MTGLDGRGPSSISSSRRCRSEAFALGRATYGRRINVPSPPTRTLPSTTAGGGDVGGNGARTPSIIGADDGVER